MAFSGGHEQGPFDLVYYLKGALAGKIEMGFSQLWFQFSLSEIL